MPASEQNMFKPIDNLSRMAGLLLACGVILAGPLEFTRSSPLNTSRRAFSATKLSDGRVLVAGGEVPIYVNGIVVGRDLLSSAEIFDPATGTWSYTGSMNVSRVDHSGTLLNNGRVLVVGGDGFGGSAEIYDPSTALWSLVAPMPSNRSKHGAVLLLDGRVLIAGGNYNVSNVTAVTPIYSPANNTWTIPGLMKKARVGMTLNLLQSGSALATGGFAPNELGERTQATAELFDPNTETWSFTGSLSFAREFHLSVCLVDGTVLAAGGNGVNDHGDHVDLSSAEIYDPASASWMRIGDMRSAMSLVLAQVLSDGNVLVVGSPQTQIFYPDSRTWYTIPPPGLHHALGALVSLPDGKALLVGGSEWNGTLSSYSESFSETSGSFSLSVFAQGNSETLVMGQGSSGQPYSVQSSETLTDGFAALSGVILADSQGLFSLVDFRPIVSKRFYRAQAMTAARTPGSPKPANEGSLSRVAKKRESCDPK